MHSLQHGTRDNVQHAVVEGSPPLQQGTHHANRAYRAHRAYRSQGLDTLRAIAITLVFMYHYKVFVSGEDTFGWASAVGWVGVDLFFVLSGYLISNQIFSGLARGTTFSAANFYARRALRTLPVFWFVLVLYFLWPNVMGGKTPPPLWTFLTFTQNFGLQPGTAFSHAWSLCIEEQFYFVLPMLILLGIRFKCARLHGWLLIAALAILGISARIFLWQTYGRESDGQVAGYYPNVYYATLCRFDEFLPGIAIAMLKNFHQPLWARLMAHGQAILLIGVIAVMVMLSLAFHYYYIDGIGYGFFMTAFGYTLIAVAFALLLAASLSPISWLYRIRIPGAYSLALWSYSLYLSHKAVATILSRQLKAFELSPSLTVALIALASIACGWLLYRVIEAPFLAIRDKHFALHRG
jgi:peptidoglycan/LPS O-acetylase OafA/YrhL